MALKYNLSQRNRKKEFETIKSRSVIIRNNGFAKITHSVFNNYVL